MDWNKNTDLIVSGAGDDHIRVFQKVKSCHIFRICSCRILNSSKIQDPEVVSEDAPSFCKIAETRGHSSDVNCVAWHPKIEHLFASCGDDNVIKLWRLEAI